MNNPGCRKVGKFIVMLFPLLLLGASLCGCQGSDETVFQGYAEGDFILIAAPLAGRLEKLGVQRGAQVESGCLLFSLENQIERSAVTVSEQELRRAESRLTDLQKGQRPSELKSLMSRLDKAKVSLALSRKELDRRKLLSQDQVISTEELDRAQTVYSADKATLDQLQAEYDTARLGARIDAIEAARAELDAARARLEQARWGVEQKTQFSPQAALVYETLYEPGEYVPAGYPVVSLLPANNIKLRFFVPEPLLGSLALGQHVAASSDGSNRSLPATISFISPAAEFTPPMIFSRETRSKLVFMIEARPASSVVERFHPGQPVDIRLDPVYE